MNLKRAQQIFKTGAFQKEAGIICAEASYDAYYTDMEAESIESRQNWNADHYISLSHEGNHCLVIAKDNFAIIAFRGTASLKDHCRNLMIRPFHWKDWNVHTGFLQSFLSIWKNLEDCLHAILPDPKTARLVITGHSAGGAMASLCGWHMETHDCGEVAGVYTFGAPRHLGRPLARKMTNQMNGRLFRVVNKGDIVPRLIPPYRYRHAGDLVYFNREDMMIFEPSWYYCLYDRIRATKHYSVRQHSAADYAAMFI
jgi:hypothetical protein